MSDPAVAASTPPSPHVAARDMNGSVTEAVAAAVAGGALGAAVSSLVGMPVLGGVVGAANGAISGRRGVYDWSTVTGTGAFVLDSTWSLFNTATALAAHALGAVRGAPDYQRRLSFRQNRDGSI